MSLDQSASGNLSGHRQFLGVCWLAYGIFRLIMAICLVLFNGTATVMFGALLGRVPDPFALMGDFHAIYAAIVVLTVLCGRSGSPGKSTASTHVGHSYSFLIDF
jgi:hypothetical protein